MLRVCELFGETIRYMFGCFCYFVVECDGVVECGSGVPYWIDHVWCSIECVCCACGPSERLDAPSICFVCVFVCRKLSFRDFQSWVTGVCSSNVVSLCDFAYYVFG